MVEFVARDLSEIGSSTGLDPTLITSIPSSPVHSEPSAPDATPCPSHDASTASATIADLPVTLLESTALISTPSMSPMTPMALISTPSRSPTTPTALIATTSTSPTTPTASMMTPAALDNHVNGAVSAPISQLLASSVFAQEGQQDSGLDAPMEVDGNNEAAGAVIAPPAWLAKTNMPEYLRGITNDKAWQELVSSLYQFESLNTTTGVSPCQ